MLTKKQIATASAEAQIAFCLGKYNSFEEALARAIEALVRAECVPPGFKVVPVGPTEAMCIAGGDVLCPYTTEHSVSMYEQAADCWKVMLNAASDTTPKDPAL